MGRWVRRLRGAIGNAVVWGLGWFGAGIGVTAALFVMGTVSGVPFWDVAIALGQNFAKVGFFMGGGFSLYLGIAARNQTLDELRPWRLSLGAAGLAAVGIGALTVFAGGAGTPIGILASMVGIAGGLAGGTALATLKIAQSGLPEGASRRRITG